MIYLEVNTNLTSWLGLQRRRHYPVHDHSLEWNGKDFGRYWIVTNNQGQKVMVADEFVQSFSREEG